LPVDEKIELGDLYKAALDLIHGASTLTLATAGNEGPWSAPVYYVYSNNGFYFFSSPQSRHIIEAMQSDQAAASLFDPADAWQAIRGIQMSGKVDRAQSIALSLKIIALYLKRFPFTREFFHDAPHPNADDFYRRFKARLFVFVPEKIYYMDNRMGFGVRKQIEL
jgi:hypothetical protein